MSRLIELAEKYSCDKLFSHSYIPVYEQMLTHPVHKLLEIGIGYEDLMKPFVPQYIHGASLKMWEKYWPEAQIFGCDIRQETLFHDGRIQTFWCDQSNITDLLDLIQETSGNWDVVIDDGSHVKEHQILTARVLMPHLAIGGVYVIEDIPSANLDEVAKAVGGETFNGTKRDDDNLVIIKRFNARWT